MNAIIWQTAGGKWDVIVISKDDTQTRLIGNDSNCYGTEAEAMRIIQEMGWNLLSVVRCM